MNKNNFLKDILSIKELEQIPVTYHFIVPMSEAREYEKLDYNQFISSYNSDFYQTKFKFLKTNYKSNFLL